MLFISKAEVLVGWGESMKFKLFDTVRINKDCGEEIKNGETGVVIMVFEKPQEAYEIEVLDESGKTKAQCTLCADDLEKNNLPL